MLQTRLHPRAVQYNMRPPILATEQLHMSGFVDLLTQIWADRPVDVPQRGVIVWQRLWGQGDGGKESATQGVLEAQWMCLVDETLWSVSRCTGRFYKSSSDTDCSRPFTVSKKTRERIRMHSRDACFPSGWYSSSQGVVFHLHLSPTNIQYVCDWLQLFEDRHNNKGMMVCWSSELKLDVI